MVAEETTRSIPEEELCGAGENYVARPTQPTITGRAKIIAATVTGSDSANVYRVPRTRSA